MKMKYFTFLDICTKEIRVVIFILLFLQNKQKTGKIWEKDCIICKGLGTLLSGVGLFLIYIQHLEYCAGKQVFWGSDPKK